jgi:hypothetical protein
MNTNALTSLIKLFEYYRSLGQKTMDQVSDEGLFWQYNEESNSIAIIVKHLHGNMLSRWTDFLTTDGEKESRERDGEFEATIRTRHELQAKYDEGWNCVFHALRPLEEADLQKVVYIRNMGHTVLEAIHRQVAHYAYHVGQIVFIGKQLQDGKWQTLSIARHASKSYNAEKFSKEKSKRHFTEEL